MNQPKVNLAFDIGASSGRIIAGFYQNNKIHTEEVYRFKNEPIIVNNKRCWDLKEIYHQLTLGLKAASSRYRNIASIGVDTWGLDYCLLDDEMNPLHTPINYRDDRTEGIPEELPIPFESFYDKTGIQFMRFNTVYQLYSDFKENPDYYQKAAHLLFIPDLINHFLTGSSLMNEYTVATTSQLINAYTKNWDDELIEQLGFPKRIFKDIISPGETAGLLRHDLAEETGIKPIPVISVGSHDTASAVAGIPLRSKESAYLICGSWSLIGIETESPIITPESLTYNLTNEGGVFNTFRVLKNINGTYLLQQLKKCYNKSSHDAIDFPDIIQAAKDAVNRHFIIEPNHSLFMSSDHIINDIREYCRSNKQGIPNTLGEYAIAIYNGLTNEFSQQIKHLEAVLNHPIETIHMVGGGSQDQLLCQITADLTQKKVISGPVESSALGNICMQMYALNQLSSLSEIRQLILNSSHLNVYEPTLTT
ncbi:rhamnulokinase family protein [Scopulibacillus cellulosilyticus]|uniref:Rhamnulokinase family protein n=2 Tax=Scopulibacillus cellulosilyticus TaxID=2665665 RepID=A0ABW2Q2L4_9BACL